MTVYNSNDKAFYNAIITLTNNARDIVHVNKWRVSYNKLCDQLGYLVLSVKHRKGSTRYFVCRNQEAYDRLKKSRIISDFITGHVSKEGKLALSELLSIPPSAASANAYKIYDQSTEIKVNYHGISFTSYEDTFIQDIQWLVINVKPRLKKE